MERVHIWNDYRKRVLDPLIDTLLKNGKIFPNAIANIVSLGRC
jgi:hypothetical protein